MFFINTNVFKLKLRDNVNAYNGSIIKYQDQYIMAYRVNHAPINGWGNDTIELCWLDQEFKLNSMPFTLECPHREAEDPRLVLHKNKITIVLGVPGKKRGDWLQRSLAIATLKADQITNSFKQISYLRLYAAGIHQPCEKNWTPFIYNDDLYLSYSISPHRVLKFNSNGLLSTAYITEKNLPFSNKFISGGTPAIPINSDEYLAFFHVMNYPIKHLQEHPIPEKRALAGTREYAFGCYTFSRKPPFELIRSSLNPLEYQGMFSAPNVRVTRDEKVVYPAGLFIDGAYVYISVGENDSCIKIIRYELNRLLSSLEPVKNGTVFSIHDRKIIVG